MPSRRYKFSRYAMYENIESTLSSLSLINKSTCLLVGDSLVGKGDNNVVIKNTAIIDMLPNEVEVQAPPYPEVDIMDMPYKSESFDFVIADQVIEHVENPWKASDEVWRVLKFGGIAIITSVLMLL